MQTLKMKIVGFDRLNSTLQIKFCFESAKKDIDKYEAHNFNVIELREDITLDDILKALAKNGWNIAFQQSAAEDIAEDNDKVTKFESLISKEFSYSEQDLFAIQASDEQPPVEGLMVI
jgi:hypothetical protein